MYKSSGTDPTTCGFDSWAVILPTETDPRRVPKFELVIYQAPKVSSRGYNSFFGISGKLCDGACGLG